MHGAISSFPVASMMSCLAELRNRFAEGKYQWVDGAKKKKDDGY
jgi:hypothetical protein